MVQICSTKGSCKILAGNPEGARPVVKQRRKLEDNIKVHLKEIECKRMGFIQTAHDRVQLR
jgi:hypothetical protein